MLGQHNNSYLFTKKASYLPYDQSIVPFSLSYIPDRLYDYFLNIRSSLFIYFPVLLFAILGLKSFVVNFKKEYQFILSTFSVCFIVLLSFMNFGESCYGPRHLLFALPLLSLPFISTLEQLLDRNTPRFKRLLVAGLVSITLSFSFYLQFNVAKAQFFANYKIYDLFKPFDDDEIKDYFKTTHPALVYMEFHDFVTYGEGFYPFFKVAQRLDPSTQKRLYLDMQRFNSIYLNCNFSFKLLCKI